MHIISNKKVTFEFLRGERAWPSIYGLEFENIDHGL